MVLSYSRRIFLRFSLNARMDSFLRGHVLAFAEFGGVPWVLLYDNLKSAVIERVGDAIRFNADLLAFAAAHRYEPRPVAVARGNDRGPREACFVGWCKRDALNEASATSATTSSPPARSPTWTTSTRRRRPGVKAKPETGAGPRTTG